MKWTSLQMIPGLGAIAFVMGVIVLNYTEHPDSGLQFVRAKNPDTHWSCADCAIVGVRSLAMRAKWIQGNEQFFQIIFLRPNKEDPNDPVRYVMYAVGDRSIKEMGGTHGELSFTRLSNFLGQQPKFTYQGYDHTVWSVNLRSQP